MSDNVGKAPPGAVPLKSQSLQLEAGGTQECAVCHSALSLLEAGQLVFGVRSLTETRCIILMAPTKVINTNENCSKDIQKCLRRKLYNALHLLCAFYHTQRTQRRSPCSELRIKLHVCLPVTGTEGES